MRARTPILPLQVRAATLATLLVLMTAAWSVGLGVAAGAPIDILDPIGAARGFVVLGAVVMVVMCPAAVLAVTLVRGRRWWWVALVVLALTLGAGIAGMYTADDIFVGLGGLLSITWMCGSAAVGLVIGADTRSLRRSRGAVGQPV